jgi:hypothetical protein
MKSAKAWLNEQPMTKALKIHGSQYMESGTPDLLVVYRGFTMWIELKTRKSDKPSHIQKRRLREWKAVGCQATVCWTLDEVKDFYHGTKFVVDCFWAGTVTDAEGTRE